MSLFHELKPVVAVGLAVIIAFFGIGFAWAATFDLKSAVIATGNVTVEGDHKRIQHFEGGIVERIHVRDGKSVNKGDILVTLNDVQMRAQLDDITHQIQTLAAIEARLRAERENRTDIKFDHRFLSDVSDSDLKAIIEQEKLHFKTRAKTEQSRRNVLRNKIKQIRKQITGSEHQLKAVIEQIKILDRQIARMNELVERRNARLTALDELLRARSEREAKRGELIAAIASAKVAITEIELKLLNLESERLSKINAKFTEIQAKRLRLTKSYSDAHDRIRRTVIRSPVNGRVMNVRVKTVGGVVKSGELIMEVVPDDSKMIIKARISPRDIDETKVGDTAYITFPSYPQRHLVRLESKLVYLSPDAYEDEDAKKSYYEADLALDGEKLALLAPQITLVPGLPVEVYIRTGGQTLLDYILQPILLSLERTFREQ